MYISIIVAVVLCTALWGWVKGFFQLVLRVSALLLAYAFAWQMAPAFAGFLSKSGLLHGLIVPPAACLLLFLAGSTVFALIARGLMRLVPKQWLESGRFAGALSGGVLGCGLGLLIVWTVSALQASWQLSSVRQDVPDEETTGKSADTFFPRADNAVRDLSGNAIASVTKKVLGDNSYATLAVNFVREPLSIGKGLQHLSSKPELHSLFQNPSNYDVLLNGSVGNIKRLPEFHALVDDPQVMQFLSATGLPGKSLSEQSESLGIVISRYTRNFENVRNNSEFQMLLQDPVLREKLQQGNLLVLLTDDKMRRLATMLSEGNASGPVSSSGQNHVAAEPETVKSLYQWRDAKGHVHITEQPPPEGIKPDVITH